MLSEKLQGALNVQMKNEFFSAYLYLAIAGYFESEDLPGIASWMRIQALEELTHGEKFFNFITEAGGRTDLRGFEAPQNDFGSPLAAFQYSLEHERFVTDSINKLMDLARDESNHAAQIFLQWFVTEQVEEESNFGLILRKLERIGNDGNGLLRLDEELGARTFVAPAPAPAPAPA
ncbi:ferritin [Geothermobacter hydrogeniphilus]|uniref:Ferritin n=1 Tax=Geothermobacter hydrogeniphilus TaxID=1969733 RepID=A0A2K2H6I6_9BACT|nr:ferritin [Geothermobacter hydrogeniphilus]PNU18860.1 ferritin [Geothermobacter hydrogeniphilus]